MPRRYRGQLELPVGLNYFLARNEKSFGHFFAGNAGCVITPGNSLTIAADNTQGDVLGQGGAHIIYHYDDPYNYGVMQGVDITEHEFVGKNVDYPTCFFSDQKRMRWAL